MIFHFGFAKNPSTCGEFGSFLGGVLGTIVGFLSFIGLLLNLDLTKKQFKSQSDDNKFFNMLKLHNNKVESISYDNDVCFAAFKHYVAEFNKFYDDKSIGVARRCIANEPRRLHYNDYAFLWDKYIKFHRKENNFFAG
jgi:hypothetical protein